MAPMAPGPLALGPARGCYRPPLATCRSLSSLLLSALGRLPSYVSDSVGSRSSAR
jgi:hypothetical protein